MNLKDAVQTAILIVSFFMLVVFGGSYYFIQLDENSSTQPLKDSLSITSSFFGGFATLTAAYIASKMFNDWREQQKHQNALLFAQTAIESYKVFDKKLNLLEDNLYNLLEILESKDPVFDNIFLDELYSDIQEDAYKVLIHFYYFHDDILNFWYVSSSKITMGNDLDKWENEIFARFNLIMTLDAELSIEDNLRIAIKLTTFPDDEFDAYTVIIKNVILKPLRLNK